MIRLAKRFLLISFSVIVVALTYQITHQKTSAQTTDPAAVCGTSPTDVVLTIDRSGSMTDPAGTSGTKLSNAKSAAKKFVTILSADTRNRVGVVSFSTQATIDHPINANFDAAKTDITNITAGGDTCTECGAYKSNVAIAENGRANVKKVVILLTDGKANVIRGSSALVGNTLAEKNTIEEVKKSHEKYGTVFFTIGLGNSINADFLKKIASLTGGKYYASATTDQLDGIYSQISQIIAKGSISGIVFEDSNNNGVFDNLEPVLSDWDVELTKTGAIPVAKKTDANGAYSFPELCDGSYTIKQTVKSGYTQTLPADNANYTVSVAGNAVSSKNFGNAPDAISPEPSCVRAAPTLEITPGAQTGKAGEEKQYNVKITNNDTTSCGASNVALTGTTENLTWDMAFSEENPSISPGQAKDITLKITSPSDAANGPVSITVNAQMVAHALLQQNILYIVDNPDVEPTAIPTSSPANTKLNLKIGIDGIGTTVKIPIGGNKNPTHKNRNLTVRLYNSSTNTPAEVFTDTSFTYNSTSEKFEGILNFSDSFQSGIYNIYVEGPQYLRGQIPGSVSLVKGETKTASTLDLVTGDINKVDRSNNSIDLQDYNVLLSCSVFSQDRSACDIDPDYQELSDLDDSGIVNEDDITLWLKEVANQGGTQLPSSN